MEALLFPIVAIILVTLFYLGTRINEKHGRKDSRDIFEKMEGLREQRKLEKAEAERALSELEQDAVAAAREAEVMPPQGLKAYVRSSLEVVYRARGYIVSAIIIFAAFACIGALGFERFSVLLDPLKELAQHLREENTVGIILAILKKNLIAVLVVMLGGIAFGIIPIFSLAVNGVMLGVVIMSGFQKGLSVSVLFAAILPHGVFELPAVFIASGVALRIGLMQFKRQGREPARKRLAEGMRVLIFIVLPLLVVAAVIEGVNISFLR